LTEETSSFTPPNKPESERWISRDVPALAARLATAPIFVDLEAGLRIPYPLDPDPDPAFY
jgi:cytochrome oxidase assembly protein ShyY1